MLKDKVEILEQLPPILREIEELIKIANVEDPVLTALWLEIEKLVDNQFILTADDEGIKRREVMHRLKVSNTESLEARRLRLMALYSDELPYTRPYLKRYLDGLLGVNNYDLVVDPKNKLLELDIESTFKELISIIEERLEQIVPQNTLLNLRRLMRFKQISQLACLGGTETTIYPPISTSIHVDTPNFVSMVTLSGTDVTIYPYAPQDSEQSNITFISAALLSGSESIIYPKEA